MYKPPPQPKSIEDIKPELNGTIKGWLSPFNNHSIEQIFENIRSEIESSYDSDNLHSIFPCENFESLPFAEWCCQTIRDIEGWITSEELNEIFDFDIGFIRPVSTVQLFYLLWLTAIGDRFIKLINGVIIASIEAITKADLLFHNLQYLLGELSFIHRYLSFEQNSFRSYTFKEYNAENKDKSTIDHSYISLLIYSTIIKIAEQNYTIYKYFGQELTDQFYTIEKYKEHLSTFFISPKDFKTLFNEFKPPVNTDLGTWDPIHTNLSVDQLGILLELMQKTKLTIHKSKRDLARLASRYFKTKGLNEPISAGSLENKIHVKKVEPGDFKKIEEYLREMQRFLKKNYDN